MSDKTIETLLDELEEMIEYFPDSMAGDIKKHKQQILSHVKSLETELAAVKDIKLKYGVALEKINNYSKKEGETYGDIIVNIWRTAKKALKGKE